MGQRARCSLAPLQWWATTHLSAPQEITLAMLEGAAYVYNGSDLSLAQTFTNPGGTAGAGFGSSVAVVENLSTNEAHASANMTGEPSHARKCSRGLCRRSGDS